jgi:hypothetical protein
MAQAETGAPRKLNRLYKFRDGKIDKGASDQVTGVVIEVKDGGHRVETDLADLFPAGLPDPCMGLAAAAFGLQTVLGNEIAGKDLPGEELARLMSERRDSILDGEWSEGRTGPRLKFVLDAWSADAKERGQPVTDESIGKVKAKLLAGEWTSKQLLDKPGIRKHYDAAELSRVTARYAASKEKAEASAATEHFDV